MSLDAICDGEGHIAVLALDHRDSLRRHLRPDDPDSITAADITELKVDIARQLAPRATGIMIEPEYSLPQLDDAGVIPSGVGRIVALEAQGYLTDPGSQPTSLLPGWSPAQAKAAGADVGKLLVHFHPEHDLASTQLAVAHAVKAMCDEAGLDLVLEPLPFGTTPADHTEAVIDTARRFAEVGAALLKLPHPIHPSLDPSTAGSDACARLNEAAAGPWAILSAGVGADRFAVQVAQAVDAGARGFMAGRAVWGDAVAAMGDERTDALTGEATRRWNRLINILTTSTTSHGDD